MKRIWRRAGGGPWVATLLTVALGCAAVRLPDPPVAELTGQRQRRKQEAVEQFSENRDLAEFQSAQAGWDRGDAQACEQSLRRLLQRNPTHRDARLLLAEVYLAGHRTAEAHKEIKQALQAHPNDPQVQYAMGLVLEMSNRGAEGLAYYERAAKSDPDNEVYAVGYHTALEAARRPAASTAESNEPQPLVPQQNNVAAWISGRAERQEKPCPPSGEGLRRARKSPDASSPSVVTFADLVVPEPVVSPASSQSKSEGATTSGPAAAAADAAGRAGPAGSAGSAGAEPVEALLRKGDAALCEGSPEEALACFREAAALRPDNPQILISTAAIALKYNQPDLAIELLQPAAKRFARSAPLQRILGVAYYRLGEYPSSQVALQQALSLDKSSALSYFLMGCTLRRLGERESAEAHFRQAQALDPRYTVRR
jgi:tetratricopeptide (TPR) repeat protein